MIEITCLGKSPSEAEAKCIITEMLLTEKIMSTDMAIKVLKSIGDISIKVRDNNGHG